MSTVAPQPSATLRRFSSLAELLSANVEISLPPCPAVFIQLNSIIANPDRTRIKLGDVLAADQALCLQILRLANSAFLGMSRQVRSIDEAVFRIGYQQIWAMAVAIKAREMVELSAGGWSSTNEVMWQHAFRAGIFAKQIGKVLDANQASVFFTAGILHDLGKWILIQAAPGYSALLQDTALSGPALIAREKETIGTHHAKLGGELIRFWKLPEVLARLVESHHEVSADNLAVKSDAHVLPMADDLVHKMDLADESQGLDPEKLFEKPVLARAGLSQRDCNVMIAEYQRMRDMFKSAG